MRSVPIREFLIGYLTTGLEPGEILVGVEIPRPARSQRAGISKLCRKAGAFAHSLAVTVIQDSQPARCVLGCAASTPILSSEEHTSALQSLMRISYAVFRMKKKKTQ